MTASGVLDRGTLQPPPALLDRHAHHSTLRSTPTSDGISRLIASPPFGVNLSSVRRASSSFVIHRAWEPYVYILPSDTLQGINHPVRLRYGEPDTGSRSREQFSREARAPLREHIR